jgi:hypothetical protein
LKIYWGSRRVGLIWGPYAGDWMSILWPAFEATKNTWNVASVQLPISTVSQPLANPAESIDYWSESHASKTNSWVRYYVSYSTCLLSWR